MIPTTTRVGLGGLPNEEGVVELDACCMHGPTRRAGSVGGVRNIKNVSMVAKAVMEHTGHVMLVGEGAERFAVAVGFPRENLLTERSRKIWLLWKEYHSTEDWWGPGIADPHWKPPALARSQPQADLWKERIRQLECPRRPARHRARIPHGSRPPRSFSADRNHPLFRAQRQGRNLRRHHHQRPRLQTAGPLRRLAHHRSRLLHRPGRGFAGATGSGEENIKVAGAHTIVENMRRGMSPLESGMDALKRIARNYNNDMSKLKFVDMTYYVLRKDGAYAGVSLWEGYSERNRTKSPSTTARAARK